MFLVFPLYNVFHAVSIVHGQFILMTEVSDRLLEAMIQVESSGDDHARGDGGRSWGCLQIRQEYVDDVNEYAGTSYTHDDAFDREKAKDMVRKYMQRYATKRRLGHDPTDEDIARIHNGGPNGYNSPNTQHYWSLVRAELAKH